MNGENNTASVIQSFAAAQETTTRWLKRSDFYRIVPPYYRNFYEYLLKYWLDWYDGTVVGIHGQAGGIASTKIGAAIVNGAARKITRGGIMFENGDTPALVDEKGIGEALNFISDKWAKKCNFNSVVYDAVREAFAGGTSFIKLNPTAKGDLWCETYRPDRAFATFGFDGTITSYKDYLNSYQRSENNGECAYTLTEERYFKDLPIKKHIPVRVFSVYRTALSAGGTASFSTLLDWRDLPRPIRDMIKNDYNALLIGQEQALPFSDHLGVEAIKHTNQLDSIPGVEYGESLLSNILTYLFSYDYYFSCLNTDMYLGRGRAIVPKSMKSPTKDGHNQNSGLDSFLFTKVEYQSTDDKKIEPLQFALRASEWREIRNNLIESIAFATGMSVGSIASFLNDTSNRTAKEVSAEETQTQEFIEHNRGMFTAPFNRLLKVVCRYNGFTDDVVIRWSKAGMTNETNRTENALRKYQSGTSSLDATLKELNPDMDEYQRMKEKSMIEAEQEKKQQSNLNMFGDMGGGTII